MTTDYADDTIDEVIDGVPEQAETNSLTKTSQQSLSTPQSKVFQRPASMK